MMLRVFICGEKYLLLLSSEFLWIDVLGVKKEVAQREQAARAERNGGTTTALDGVSGSWYVNQVGDERFRHLQREVNFSSVYVFVHRHGRRGGPERGGEVSCVRLGAWRSLVMHWECSLIMNLDQSDV